MYLPSSVGGVDGEGGHTPDKGGHSSNLCCLSGSKRSVLNSYAITDVLLIVYNNFSFRLKKENIIIVDNITDHMISSYWILS